MTAYLIWRKSKTKKAELQIWRFDPDKALRKHTGILKKVEITDAEADKLTLKELEAMYGIVIFSDILE
jgi:hypothetical protein